MSDPLLSIREEGYQAFLSNFPITINPFDIENEWLNWREWETGYRAAEKDNDTATD